MGIGMAKTGLGGLGMVVVPVMANIFGAKSSTGILLLLLIMADFFGVRYYHMHADLRQLIKLIPSTIIGILTGVFIGDILSDVYFQFLLGAVIISGALIMVIKVDIKENNLFSIAVGFLGGFITMIGNAAGPIMSIYFLSMGFDKNKFIGTAAWFFLFVNLFKVPMHVFIWKTIDLNILLFDLSLFPFILVGAVTGVWIVKKIPERPYKIFVIVSVILSTFNLFI
ncbi:MAG: sulfite exporter TauE/SafE family protein [Candidatus Marinimicrobia bacterium]|nr:sulfite exporter TauE/SafE family protein [Candidatus Neomarinimicrobiota bacterium]